MHLDVGALDSLSLDSINSLAADDNMLFPKIKDSEQFVAMIGT